MARRGRQSGPNIGKTRSVEKTAAEEEPVASGRPVMVLDTSVLLSDPYAISRFGENEVVLPMVVLIELEAKRIHPELGYFARAALHELESLREVHGRLDKPVSLEEGGTLRIDTSNVDASSLPPGMWLGDNDSRILGCANLLRRAGREVTLVSKDLPLRLKAGVANLRAEQYRAEQIVYNGWTGFAGVVGGELDLSDDEFSALYESGGLPLDFVSQRPDVDADSLVSNAFIRLPSRPVVGKNGEVEESGQLLARVRADGLRAVSRDRVKNLSPRNPEQIAAIDLLHDESVPFVSLGGPPGTGKSVLAILAGIEAVEKRLVRRVLVFKPMNPVGGQDMGFLPGTEDEKFKPWTQSINEAVEKFVEPKVLTDLRSNRRLEVHPITHILGRTFHDSFVVVDEAQQFEIGALILILSRLGENSRMVLTHDLHQQTNTHVGRYDGIAAVISAMMGSEMFGHVTLVKSERSAAAEEINRRLGHLLVPGRRYR